MANFLVDENLPYNLSLWNSKKYIHVYDIGKSLTDNEIWKYAKENDLIIITKDADFYNNILISDPPPKVIHLRIGNMRLNELHNFLQKIWNDVLNIIITHKMAVIYSDRIEGIK